MKYSPSPSPRLPLAATAATTMKQSTMLALVGFGLIVSLILSLIACGFWFQTYQKQLSNSTGTGIVGPTGEQGIQGIQGVQGVQGVQGLVGEQGPQGLQGLQGVKGDQGVKGNQGDRGQGFVIAAKFPSIEYVSMIAGVYDNHGVAAGQFAMIDNPSDVDNDGKLFLWIDNTWQDTGDLRAPAGIQGVKGDTGAQGIQGVQGTQGPAGSIGLQGIQGAQGIQGMKGDAGSQGIQGIQGLQGEKGDTGATGATGPVGDVGASGSSLNWIPSGYQSNTNYYVNDALSYQGSSYVCVTAHMSTSMFDTSKWQILAQGADQSVTASLVASLGATSDAKDSTGSVYARIANCNSVENDLQSRLGVLEDAPDYTTSANSAISALRIYSGFQTTRSGADIVFILPGTSVFTSASSTATTLVSTAAVTYSSIPSTIPGTTYALTYNSTRRVTWDPSYLASINSSGFTATITRPTSGIMNAMLTGMFVDNTASTGTGGIDVCICGGYPTLLYTSPTTVSGTTTTVGYYARSNVPSSSLTTASTWTIISIGTGLGTYGSLASQPGTGYPCFSCIDSGTSVMYYQANTLTPTSMSDFYSILVDNSSNTNTVAIASASTGNSLSSYASSVSSGAAPFAAKTKLVFSPTNNYPTITYYTSTSYLRLAVSSQATFVASSSAVDTANWTWLAIDYCGVKHVGQTVSAITIGSNTIGIFFIKQIFSGSSSDIHYTTTTNTSASLPTSWVWKQGIAGPAYTNFPSSAGPPACDYQGISAAVYNDIPIVVYQRRNGTLLNTGVLIYTYMTSGGTWNEYQIQNAAGGASPCLTMLNGYPAITYLSIDGSFKLMCTYSNTVFPMTSAASTWTTVVLDCASPYTSVGTISRGTYTEIVYGSGTSTASPGSLNYAVMSTTSPPSVGGTDVTAGAFDYVVNFKAPTLSSQSAITRTGTVVTGDSLSTSKTYSVLYSSPFLVPTQKYSVVCKNKYGKAVAVTSKTSKGFSATVLPVVNPTALIALNGIYSDYNANYYMSTVVAGGYVHLAYVDSINAKVYYTRTTFPTFSITSSTTWTTPFSLGNFGIVSMAVQTGGPNAGFVGIAVNASSGTSSVFTYFYANTAAPVSISDFGSVQGSFPSIFTSGYILVLTYSALGYPIIATYNISGQVAAMYSATSYTGSAWNRTTYDSNMTNNPRYGSRLSYMVNGTQSIRAWVSGSQLKAIFVNESSDSSVVDTTYSTIPATTSNDFQGFSLGFYKQSPIIVYQKRFDTTASSSPDTAVLMYAYRTVATGVTWNKVAIGQPGDGAMPNLVYIGDLPCVIHTSVGGASSGTSTTTGTGLKCTYPNDTLLDANTTWTTVVLDNTTGIRNICVCSQNNITIVIYSVDNTSSYASAAILGMPIYSLESLSYPASSPTPTDFTYTATMI